MFCVFGKKTFSICDFSVKRRNRHNFRISCFPGSAEALVRWGGKIKYILIAYFLGNIFAKNCCNRSAYAKIIASRRWDVFWDTVYKADLQLPNCLLNSVQQRLNGTAASRGMMRRQFWQPFGTPVYTRVCTCVLPVSSLDLPPCVCDWSLCDSLVIC